jgi:predicted amidohydrolase
MVVDVKGIRTAAIICSDVQDAGFRAQLNELGPELILGSLANPSDRNWFVGGMTAKMFDAWIVTANRIGADGGNTYDGNSLVADPLGDLRVAVKDREGYLYYDIGFAIDASPAVTLLRRAYVAVSLVAHMATGLGLLLPAG